MHTGASQVALVVKKKKKKTTHLLMQVRHKRHGFDSYIGKMPWRRAQQPTSIFLPGESIPWTEEPQATVQRVTQSWT